MDNYIASTAERFAPHLWVLSPDKPDTISKNLELQGPTIDNWNNWLNDKHYLERIAV